MIDKIKEIANKAWGKIKQAWGWIKRTWKKTLVVLGVGTGIALAAGFPPVEPVNPLELIIYSSEVETDIDKLEYAIKAEELLRLEHNVKGKEYRDGVIIKEEWNAYLDNEYNPRSRMVSGEVARLKDVLEWNITTEENNPVKYENIINLKRDFKKSTRWTIEISKESILK